MKVLKIPNYRKHYLCVAACIVNMFYDKLEDPRKAEFEIMKKILMKPLFYTSMKRFVGVCKELGAKETKVIAERKIKDPEELVKVYKEAGIEKLRKIKDWESFEKMCPEEFLKIGYKNLTEKVPIEGYKNLIFEEDWAIVDEEREITNEFLKELIEEGNYIWCVVKINGDEGVAVVHGFDGKEFYVYPPSKEPFMTEDLVSKLVWKYIAVIKV